MRFSAICFGSGDEILLCQTNFRVLTVADTFGENICHLAFVAISSGFKSLYVVDKFGNLSIVYYSDSSCRVVAQIPKFTVAIENNDVEDRDVRVVWKQFAESGDVGSVLPNRIVELVLFLTIGQNLHPILIVAVAEDPSAVILDFKHDDSLWRRDGKVNLCVCTVLFADVQVVVYCTLVDSASVYELRYQVPFRPGPSVHSRDRLNLLTILLRLDDADNYQSDKSGGGKKYDDVFGQFEY